MNRLYHPTALISGNHLTLSTEASHHILRVLRLAIGDKVEVFNGNGHSYNGTIVSDDVRGATIALTEVRESNCESPCAIGLAQALPAGDKMDWVIEKATELGVTAIQPLFSRKTLLKLEGDRAERRLSHWRRIAIAACMQSGRNRIPMIAPPLPLERWLAEAIGIPDYAYTPHLAQTPSEPRSQATPERFILSPRGARRLREIDHPSQASYSTWLLAGPEGGWTETEEQAAYNEGWQALRLGPRILRSETAGLAAIAALQVRFGDF